MFSADDLAVYPSLRPPHGQMLLANPADQPCNMATRSPTQANGLRLTLSGGEYRASTLARRNRSKHRCSTFVRRGQASAKRAPCCSHCDTGRSACGTSGVRRDPGERDTPGGSACDDPVCGF